MDTYVGSCSWYTTPCIDQKGRRPHRHWSPHTASCYYTTCTQNRHSYIHCRRNAVHMEYGTASHCGWLENGYERKKTQVWKRISTSMLSFQVYPVITAHLLDPLRDTWSFTQAAVERVYACCCLQTTGTGLSQVSTKSSITGFTRQPLQCGVSERGHVLPAPVWYIHLPQTHPGCHHQFGLCTHINKATNQRESFCKAV